jgi:hypothetical protein
MKSFALIAVLALPLLVGCSETKPADSSFVPQSPIQSLEQNLSDAQLYCANSSECPDNVGYIVGIQESGDETGVYQCTGSLIASDVVVTNSHCIPEGVKDGTAECSHLLGIKFPATNGHPEETAICDHLITASSIVDKGNEGFLTKPDYAVFKLKSRLTRANFSLDRAGIKDGVSLTIYSVDPMSKYELRGRLVKRSCTSTKGSLMNPDDVDTFSDVILGFGSNCDVHGGNSGSPAMGQDGKVVGLLHGGIKEGISLEDTIGYSNIESTLYKPAFITNLACIQPYVTIPTLAAPNDGCAGVMDRISNKKAASEKALKNSLLDAANVNYKAFLKNAGNIFKFESVLTIKKVGDSQSGILTPKILCVAPHAQWESGAHPVFSIHDQKNVMGKVTATIVTTSYSADTYDVKVKYDPYLRPVEKLIEASKVHHEVTFDLLKVGNGAQAGTETVTPTWLQSVEIPLNLRTCTDKEMITDIPLKLDDQTGA